MKLLIGIPAFNEGKVINSVLNTIPQNIPGIRQIDTMVVDDGSTDDTNSRVKGKKIIVLRHILNRGLGGALKTILSYAKSENYDILVTMDADGQHDSKDIVKLVQKIIKGKDVVIGTRWQKNTDVPFSRWLVNRLANIITYIFFGIWSSDSQSGFRALGKHAIHSISLQTDGMEVSSEFFREIYRNKLQYSEVQIRGIYTKYSLSKGQNISNAPNVFFNLLLRFLR